MSAISSHQKGFVVISFGSNRFTSIEVNDFKELFYLHIDDEQRNFIVDFSGVEYMDSTALGTLISCYKLLNGSGTLAITSLSNPVYELFDLTRMNSIFKIFENVETAINYFKSEKI